MPIFKRTFSQDLDLLEQHLTKDILTQTDSNTNLTNLRTKFENAFNSEFKERMQKYTRFDAQSFKDAMICNMDSIGKYMLEILLYQQRTPHLVKQKKLMQTQEDHSNPIPALNVDSLKVDSIVIQKLVLRKKTMSKAKERCMAYFRSLRSHLQVLSKDNLKGTRIEHGFKRAFMSLFGQEADTFTRTMFLNVDQLQKQLGKDEFQEDGSMAAFWVINKQFQMFIDSQFTLDYDRQIFTGHRFSPNKTFAVYEKTSPRSDLRWKPTGRIFKSVGLSWIPIGKLFNSCISKINSEPPHGLNVDILNIHECKQTLDVSTCTSINVQKEQSLDFSAELKSIFGPLFDEYFNGENQVVSKSPAVTTADTSDKRQQQPDLTSSTSTLATTLTADGNFDL
uniref:Uncharacterized protein n=1 Tax=Tanacetum cinerariifolium TaxID=118510 RepID=A0A6L2KZV1_TANCI|nr:hypothetical protein [Tanacetum cinerariifolium]